MEQQIFRARRVPSATYCEQQNVIETIAGAKTQAAEIITTAQSDAEKLRSDLEVELADTRAQWKFAKPCAKPKYKRQSSC